MTQNIQDLRKDYKMASLNESDVHENPFEQFDLWFEEAQQSEVEEPNAMILSTTQNGNPHARVVLLKGRDAGFVFYSNYSSHKGQQLKDTQQAALTFFWAGLERQIRIEGCVEKVSESMSDNYFASRPRQSQLGAVASPQSQEVENRQELEKLFAEAEKEFEGRKDIPRPKHWGGYRVLPHKIEFWQGRRSRMHDRICYTWQDNDNWKISRLAP